DVPGKHYPIGTTFQPDEASLDLAPDSLRRLNRKLRESDEKAELVFDEFIVAPMSVLQRTLSNIFRWIARK
ncbi:MAG: MBL fold metallo-hydrolase, partial [Gammaproteobacteria bacterium]